jgi:hypothetical protein
VPRACRAPPVTACNHTPYERLALHLASQAARDGTPKSSPEDEMGPITVLVTSEGAPPTSRIGASISNGAPVIEGEATAPEKGAAVIELPCTALEKGASVIETRDAAIEDGGAPFSRAVDAPGASAPESTESARSLEIGAGLSFDSRSPSEESFDSCVLGGALSSLIGTLGAKAVPPNSHRVRRTAIGARQSQGHGPAESLVHVVI